MFYFHSKRLWKNTEHEMAINVERNENSNDEKERKP